MRCTHCQSDNPVSARFCGHCGAPLAVVCPQCDHPNAPGGRFCHECGHPLEAAVGPGPAAPYTAPVSYTPRHLAERVLTYRSALEGERKQVTVLFVDIVGSSYLAERLDPELMHQIMDRALRLMADSVHRYEGTVNQFLGDGLMALFGAPVALEDHAFRAVQAALAIRETVAGYSEQLRHEHGVEMRLRLGLNSGLVVVGKIGDDLRMDYTAVGDTTHLAARMQESAEPDAIVVTDATHRLVRGYVRSEPLGTVKVRGRSHPVEAFTITGRRQPRTRLEVSAELGLTDLIGRERELGVLQDCFMDARAGRGHIVGIAGEPGVGKSRLIYEFRRRLAAERLTWLEGHCVTYGQTTPYLPLLEICKANFHVEDGDNSLQIDEKLRQGLVRLDPDLETVLPLLRDLLGLPADDDAIRHVDPKTKRQKTFEAIRALVVAGSQRRPEIFVIEDLHWIDKTSEDCLAFLAESVAALPALLVVTHRPGYAVRWSDKTYYTELALDLLDRSEVDAMVARLLGTSHVPPELGRVVWEKAEGNPLFIEEIVRSFRESGLLRPHNGGFTWVSTTAVEIPPTVQDIIRARLDRLDDPIKHVLQTAAVIGREFPLTVLTRVSDPAAEVPRYVDTLKRLELVYELRLFPELEYIFKHALIQDVAYQTLLSPRRRDLHGAIGGAIEELYADRLDEQAPVLAYHYARSARHDRAIHYALRAGDRAAALFANAEATTYYEQALALARGLPPSPDAHRAVIDATLKLAGVGATREDIIERDRANLDAAGDLARNLLDEPRLARVLYWLGRLAYTRSQPATAIDYARQSLDIAERLGDDALAAPPVNLMGRILWTRSEFTQASELLERSVEQMRRLGNKTEEATAAGFVGFARAFMGEFDRALAYADRGLRLAREIQNPYAEAAAYQYRGTIRGGRGEWDLALEDLANASRLGERIGDLFRVLMAKIYSGLAHTMAGDPAQARVVLDECEAVRRQITTTFALAWQKSFLALALHALGEPGDVPPLCEEAIRLADAAGDRFIGAIARRTFANALVSARPPDPTKAEELLLEAIRMQEEIGNRPELARSYASYARVLGARGAREQARQVLAKALTMLEEMGMARDLAQAREALLGLTGD